MGPHPPSSQQHGGALQRQGGVLLLARRPLVDATLGARPATRRRDPSPGSHLDKHRMYLTLLQCLSARRTASLESHRVHKAGMAVHVPAATKTDAVEGGFASMLDGTPQRKPQTADGNAFTAIRMQKCVQPVMARSYHTMLHQP